MDPQTLSFHNEWAAKYFAIAIGAVMVLSILSNWTKYFFLKYKIKAPGCFSKTFIGLRRGGNRLLISKIGGVRLERLFTSSLYWGLLLVLILTDINLMDPSQVAYRLGWMTVANIVLLVFLALRHTPLAPLSSISYEKLRQLHKVAGYSCILLAVAHAFIWIILSAENGDLSRLRKTSNISGAIAAFSMVLILLSTLVLPKQRYETFYATHIFLFVLILITLGFHQPDLSIGILKIVIFAGALWVLEKGLRLSKLLWNLFGNYAILTPVSGAVRVKLSQNIHSRHAGSHTFLWLPSIRPFETHPFTMISTNPVEFLIRPHNGFTGELYNMASRNSAEPVRVRCSVDGPYGQLPNYFDFDRVILVAGGSGATFTFSIALDLIQKYKATDSNKMIDFIWTVKNHESLEWFKDELKELRSPFVKLHVYVSQGDKTPSVSSNLDLGKLPRKNEDPGQYPIIELQKGRPDVRNLVNECIMRSDSSDSTQIIGVGACGPVRLLEATRSAVMNPIHDHGPLIHLHTEEFEW